MNSNPYTARVTSPAADLFSSSDEVDAEILQELMGTRKCLWLLGVIAVLGAVFLFLVPLALLSNSDESVFFRLVAGGFGIMLLITAALYLVIGVKLIRWSVVMKRVAIQPDTQSLVAVMEQFRSFWKFAAILAIIGMGLMALAMLFAASAFSLVKD